MPRHKKLNDKSSTSKPKEKIGDIFDEIKNDEAMTNDSKKKISKEINEIKKERIELNDKKNKNQSKEKSEKLNLITKNKKESSNSEASKIFEKIEDSDETKECKNLNGIHNDKLKQLKINEKNKINMEKLAVIESLCKEYPCLKKDKEKIIKKHLEEKKQVNNPFIQNGYTLEKIILEDKEYYIDKYNNILDENTKLMGFYHDLNSELKFILFPTEKTMIQ